MENRPADQVQQHTQPSQTSQPSQPSQTAQTAQPTEQAGQAPQPAQQTQAAQQAQEMQELQHLQQAQQQAKDKYAAIFGDIKITEAGIRAVKMNDIAAGGGSRAELLNILTGMMDETIQLLYIVPSEHEAIALMSFVDRGLLELVKDDLKLDNKMMITTWKVLQTLLDIKALPEKLVLILDPSLMPLTVDMEIASGMAWVWFADLVNRFTESDRKEDIKVTAFYLTSPVQPWCIIPQAPGEKSWQTYQIDNFGCRTAAFDIVEADANEFDSFELTMKKFLLDVCQSSNDGNAGPGYAGDIDSGPPKTLLCIMSQMTFNTAMDLVDPGCRQMVYEKLMIYVVDLTKQPKDWNTTAQKFQVRGPSLFPGRVLLLDPRIGIMYKLPTITHAFICNIYSLPRYDCKLRRPVTFVPNISTVRQFQQHLQLISGLHTPFLKEVHACTLPRGLPGLAPPQMIWCPSSTTNLTQLLLEAHLAWPGKTLAEMPIEILPEPSALIESTRRLRWFGCIDKNGLLHPQVPSKLKEILSHVPDFNLAMLISGINVLDTPPRIAKVVIQMALLLYHKPENVLRYVPEEDDDRMDDSNEELDTSNVDLDDLDGVNEKQLGSSECARKGLLWRAWACMNKPRQHKASKKNADLETDVIKWETVVPEFEINRNLVHKIRQEAQTIGELIGYHDCHQGVGKLTDDNVFDVEVHLARAFIFDIAIFAHPSEVSPAISTTTAVDFLTALPLDFETRKTDVFFTPPEEDSISKNICYAIVFELSVLPEGEVATILSELFISSAAVSKAALYFTKERPLSARGANGGIMSALRGDL